MTSIETITQECDRVLALAERGPFRWDDDAIIDPEYNRDQHAPWLVGENGEPVLSGEIRCAGDPANPPMIVDSLNALHPLARALKIAVGTLQEIYQDDARNNADLASDRAYDALSATAKQIAP